MNNVSIFNEKEMDLITQIEQYKDTGLPAKTKLETDEKVLARVTDGIYRFPASAIRELISNAYDADAENVIIETDVPRFETMTIRDDGNGMSIETLINLLGHIGGSAKRNIKGGKLKVTDAHDNTLSILKKRKLIGKIGIGLFSVAQLTRDFDIITKQRGDNFYLKAKIRLHNYSEEYIRDVENKVKYNVEDFDNRGATFETGEVEIWTEPTKNIDAHGTDIILRNIKKSARDQLRSVDLWGQEAAETESDDNDGFMDSSKFVRPKFHVGNYSISNGNEVYQDNERVPNLPWVEVDEQNLKLSKLYEEILSLTNVTTNPKLNMVLDNYLYMIWTLALSIPINYIEKHPFAYTTEDVHDIYIISNQLKGQVSDLPKEYHGKSIVEILPTKSKYRDVDFNVVIDGIALFRPIRFTNLPKSKAVVDRPILFIGSYSPDLSKSDKRDSGGSLSFDAYFLWSPKVIPKDHNGILIRINNASGILFDETFMKHQVAEHTIKSQLTVEVFVHDGLDSALNIDRESFNISHPHYQILMRWVHQAIRQVVNKYKAIKRSENDKKNVNKKSVFDEKLMKIVSSSAVKSGKEIDTISNLYFISDEVATSSLGEEVSINSLPIESIKFSKEKFISLSGLSHDGSQKKYIIENKVQAILQVLEAYGLLENISLGKQECLIEDIIQIISFEG